MRKDLKTESASSTIVIERGNTRPITMCINECREDTSDDVRFVTHQYKYCLNVLSVEKILSDDEITACFKEGEIEDKHIVRELFKKYAKDL